MAGPELGRGAGAAPSSSLETRRSRIGRFVLMPLWIGFCFWLVTAPRPEPNPEQVSEIGRRFVAGLFFALILTIVGGLAKPWRWPVMLSRIVTGVVMFPMILVGRAGRESWVYTVDIAFALALAVVNFLVIRAGRAPPPRDWPRWATPRRWRRAQDMAKQQRRTP